MTIQKDNHIEAMSALPPERRKCDDYITYFNDQFTQSPQEVKAGNFLCGDKQSDLFVSEVGAGVIVTFFDPIKNIGAMSCVLIPEELRAIFPRFDEADPDLVTATLSPINEALNQLIQKDSKPEDLYIRLIGGGQLADSAPDEGLKNYVFVREHITTRNLTILNEDMGGPCVRRTYFSPENGKAIRILLHREADLTNMNDLELAFCARLLS